MQLQKTSFIDSWNLGREMARSDLRFWFIAISTFYILMKTPIFPYTLTATRNLLGSHKASSPINLNFPYSHIVHTVANREGMNPLILAAVIDIESGWDPSAVSYAGAQGLTQMMPYMQRAYDCGDVFIPAESISCGGAFLGDLIRKYGTGPGQIELAIAAYHAGEPQVDACQCVPRSIDKEYVRRWKLAYSKYIETNWIQSNNASRVSSSDVVIPFKTSYAITNDQLHIGGWGNATHGVDVSTGPEFGHTVYAPISGVVKYLGYDGVGNTVIYIVNDKCEAAMLHGNYKFAFVGQQVVAGVTPVGLESSIGNSSGPHTHFSYACHGKLINPLYITLNQN
ncbi:MAG: transglycosylase SLT domain-containing protein [Chloroflexota bacterium]